MNIIFYFCQQFPLNPKHWTFNVELMEVGGLNSKTTQLAINVKLLMEL